MVNAVANDGKEAEGYVKAALELLQQKRRSTYARLYDSRSAGFGSGGNIIPEAPSDFIVALEGTTALLEVKSSEKHWTLKDTVLRSVFSEGQMLGAKLWTRAGDEALTLFYSMATEIPRIEIWESMVIREAYLSPPRQRKLQGEPIVITVRSEVPLMEAIAMAIKFKTCKE